MANKNYKNLLEERYKLFQEIAHKSGNGRISFKRTWWITAPFSARKLTENAACLARAEGMIFHAEALEARLPYIPERAIYRVGRSKHGCSVAQIVIPGRY